MHLRLAEDYWRTHPACPQVVRPTIQAPLHRHSDHPSCYVAHLLPGFLDVELVRQAVYGGQQALPHPLWLRAREDG